MRYRAKFLTFIILVTLHACNTPDPPARQSGDQRKNVENSDCGLSDGNYNASVEYFNPNTEFNNTYTLEVVVDDCNVIEIDFPKGGYLDDDHIDATAIDDDGNADVKDDRGRSFKVHIGKEDEPEEQDEQDPPR